MAYSCQKANSLHYETEVTRLTAALFRYTQEIIWEYQTNSQNAIIRRYLVTPPRCLSNSGNRQFENNSRKPKIGQNQNQVKHQPKTA